MLCKECKDHKQIIREEFNKLPYELARQLDCKKILPDGNQCTCYSIEHAIDKEEIRKILRK